MGYVSEQKNSGLRKRKRNNSDKQTLRKIKNRQSAQESRDKQKLYIKTLETTNATLIKSNEVLVSSIEQLKLQNKDLLQKFAAILGLLNSANSSTNFSNRTYDVENNMAFSATSIPLVAGEPAGNSLLESLFSSNTSLDNWIFSSASQSLTMTDFDLKTPEMTETTLPLDMNDLFKFEESDLHTTPQTAPAYPTFKLPVPSLDMKSDPEVVESPKQILSTEMYLTLDILIRCFPMMLFAHCNQRIICQPLKLETTFPVFGNRIFKFGPSFQKRFPICHELLNPK
ncbi:hypothetical protein HDV02_004773 [Globomyces sp. JEL0801]|nr:hypothetical protein HDV02_004773 [Globomyces sp. JEL0801]